jgi:methionyl-tRNA synthetase
MSKKPFYITTTLPYVNAEPHIGFAMEIIRADVIARYKKLAGHEVFFNTGTDEHGIKIYRKAKEQGMEPQAYVDGLAEKYKILYPALGLATNEKGITFNFIRTTDPHHVKAAQEFWKIVDKNGYIYKKNYSIKYCVGCELEKTESELVDGRCPIHPLMELEIIQEENYFFKFSAFQQKLLDLYEKNPSFVIPDFRFNEIKAFVGRGLEDFSISRLATKMPWGIPVPGDENQVMYVWFDALVDYISAIGWPDDEVQGTISAGAFKKWWVESGGVVQYCGKDNLRQQSAMWQSMLMAAGLTPSQTIVINGFITGEGGLKMSKSLGNTVDPLEIVRGYGTDALRYFVIRELSPFEDSPFSMAMFEQAYNAGLANGIGNLTSRVMKMANANLKPITLPAIELPVEFKTAVERFDLKGAADIIWSKISVLDGLIQKEEPFKKVKEEVTKAHALEIIEKLVIGLAEVTVMLEPILPESAKVIWECIKENKVPEKALFMRK